MKKFWKIFLIITIFLISPSFTLAAELLEKVDFYVDSTYDLEGREKITAILERITDQLYFYFDEKWWEGLPIEEQKEVNKAISELSQEFENTIYPILTLNYGSEWKPGIDKDPRITILIHPMIDVASGYFNPGDEYPRAQVAKSNQREIIYLNSKQITSPLNKSFLAHEFTHLITFNQKEKKYGVSEEVWLNEARAEYSPTLVGYDEIYQNSYLQRRVKAFLEKPQDSLTEWQGKESDYGVANLFIHYLVDHYGKEVLIDSLKSNRTGIHSLNYALEKNGFLEDFSQIFTNWLITVFINDCQVGSKYCYLNENLKNLRVTPFIYFLPTTGESTLNVGYLTKDWAGNWQKIIGGRESLKLEFSAGSGGRFRVPYVLETTEGKSVGFLELNQSQKGTVYLKDEKIISLTLIPSTQNKVSNFSENEPSYQFSWSAVTEKSSEEEEALIAELQATIARLKTEIAQLQAQIAAILGQEIYCGEFKNNLYYGLRNNQEVKCLQEFLKSQGPEIYPEGLVTGNFLSLTKNAVIRFQEKYKEEILTPLGLEKGTGFVGLMTRQKINSLLNF